MKPYMLIVFFTLLVAFLIAVRMRLLRKDRTGPEILIELINNCCGEKPL